MLQVVYQHQQRPCDKKDLTELAEGSKTGEYDRNCKQPAASPK